MVRLLLPAALLLWTACSGPEEVAGTASKTETGEVYGTLVRQDKQPAQGAMVLLVAADTGQYGLAKTGVRGEAVVDSVKTGDDGKYRFKEIAFGAYNINARLILKKDTLTAYHGGISLDAKEYNAGTDTLVAPGKVRSEVEAGGLPVPGATCYVPGTSYSAITDDTGVCIISGIPPGTFDLAFMRDGYITGRVRGIAVVSDQTADGGRVSLEADPTGNPPSPLGLSARYDSSAGVVMLHWAPVAVSDIAGYILYRDDTAAIDPTRLSTGRLVLETSYRDTIVWTAADTAPRIYQYRIRSQDADGNRSSYARFAPLAVLPFPSTNLPPEAPGEPNPANNAMEVAAAGLIMHWSGGDPDSGDSIVYQVFMDTLLPPGRMISSTADTFIIMPALLPGVRYFWQVTASDGKESSQGQAWTFTVAEKTVVSGNPPHAPSHPAPSDYAANQDSALTLRWTGGDPDEADTVRYDIYLGTNDPPTGLIAAGLLSTEKTVESLAKGTSYFWTVLATDGKNVTPGPVWTFTVAAESTPPNSPPDIPVSPSPTNNASNQDTALVLGWSSVDPDTGDTVRYTVFFGADMLLGQVLVENYSAPSCTVTALESGKSYYWRVSAFDGKEVSLGPVWKFTTRTAFYPVSMIFISGGTYLDEYGNTAGVSDFLLQETEVTLQQYRRFIINKVNSNGINGLHDPVVDITFSDAARYANWLSNLEGLDSCFILDTLKSGLKGYGDSAYWDCDFTRNGYRLPTEDEWEYAGRSGQGFRYPTMDGTLGPGTCWFAQEAAFVKSVRQFPSSPFGLYDMADNATEYVWGSHENRPAGRFDFRAPAEDVNASSFVLRGGNFLEAREVTDSMHYVAAFFRGTYGFRLARTVSDR